jgi:regulator of sirC expression with transglutaminase-like and TPR domain
MRNDSLLLAQSINHVLFKECGIEGKTERSKQVIDDPNRLFVHEVLESKVASPIALVILYSLLAEQVGLSHEVLAMPSYFLLKVKDVAQDFYIDPFDNGRFLNQDEFLRKFRTALQKNRMVSSNLFERVTHHHLVARLTQQLKQVFILKGNALQALRAVELLTALFPHSPELARDRGILYCEMEYFSKAVEDLRFYLKKRPEADDVGEIKKLTGMLKGYREVMN